METLDCAKSGFRCPKIGKNRIHREKQTPGGLKKIETDGQPCPCVSKPHGNRDCMWCHVRDQSVWICCRRCRVQRATALATTCLAPSNSLNLSVPLNTAPPANKKVVYLQMGNVGDVVVYTSGLVAAAKAVHWQLKTIVYDLTNPQAANSAVQEAVNLNPDYITISAAQVSLFQAALTNAKAKGIPVFNLYGSEAPLGATNDIYSQVAGNAQFRLFGQIAADYAISNSRGLRKLAGELPAWRLCEPQQYQRVGEGDLCQQLSKDLQLRRGACSLDQFSAGSIPSLVVSYVQTHPNVKYLQFAPGPMTVGLVAALKAAGLYNGRIIFGATPEVANLQAVKDGLETAWIGTLHPRCRGGTSSMPCSVTARA